MQTPWLAGRYTASTDAGEIVNLAARSCIAALLTVAGHQAALAQAAAERSVTQAAAALRDGDPALAAGIASEVLARPGAPNRNALWIRGNALERLERYSEAVLDFDRLAELEPNRPGFLLALGGARFKAGDMAGSIAAFDAAAELDGTLAPKLWQRGIAHYYAGRLGDCARQFEIHRTVNPQDVENSVWHFLCVAASDGFQEARGRLIPVDRDGRVPMMEVLELFAGSGSASGVLQAAERATSSGMGDSPLFYAHLYLGLYFEAAGDKAASREHIRKAVDFRNPPNYMWQVARIHRELRERGN